MLRLLSIHVEYEADITIVKIQVMNYKDLSDKWGVKIAVT